MGWQVWLHYTVSFSLQWTSRVRTQLLINCCFFFLFCIPLSLDYPRICVCRTVFYIWTLCVYSCVRRCVHVHAGVCMCMRVLLCWCRWVYTSYCASWCTSVLSFAYVSVFTDFQNTIRQPVSPQICVFGGWGGVKGFINCLWQLVGLCVCDRFTARVTELIKVLEDLNNGRYERTMVTSNGPRGESRLRTGLLSLVRMGGSWLDEGGERLTVIKKLWMAETDHVDGWLVALSMGL